jgi:RNA polymerase sigma-70 factor (ECF subfamily)
MVDLDVHLPGIVAGEQLALAHWLAGAEPILRAKLRPLSTRVDAESVLQEMSARVWFTADRCQRDGRPNALLRYASRILRNLAIDELRRARLDATDEATLERYLTDALGEPRLPDPMLRQLIEICRRLLPPKPLAALQARLDAAGGEPDAVLAERLSMRLNTFLQNVKRARELLAHCLQRRGVDVREELR